MKRTLLLVMATCIVLIAAGVLFAQGDVAAGKEAYSKKCASCHGPSGEGKDAIAKMFKVEMRDLGSKEVQAKADTELGKISKDGTGKMKPTAGFTDKDAANVVAFVRTLAKK